MMIAVKQTSRPIGPIAMPLVSSYQYHCYCFRTMREFLTLGEV